MPNPEMVEESTEELEVTVDVEEGLEATETDAEAEGDFELVIDGEEQDSQQSEPTPADKLQHAIIREKRKRKQERDEKNELASQVQQLQAQIAAMSVPQAQVPTPQPTAPVASVEMPDPPNKMDYVTDADYERAKVDYAQKFQSWFNSVNSGNQKEAEQKAAQARRQSEIEQSVASHFSRAAKFAEENKIPVDKYQEAEIKVREVLGTDVVDHLIDVVGEGAEKGIMYLGSNAGQLQNISALVTSNNSLKAVSEFTKMASKVAIKRGKKISQAPEPDAALRGDAQSSTTADNARKHYNKLIEDNKGDISAARAYRKKMREQGIEF